MRILTYIIETVVVNLNITSRVRPQFRDRCSIGFIGYSQNRLHLNLFVHGVGGQNCRICPVEPMEPIEPMERLPTRLFRLHRLDGSPEDTARAFCHFVALVNPLTKHPDDILA
jgi:hypothetical protein